MTKLDLYGRGSLALVAVLIAACSATTDVKSTPTTISVVSGTPQTGFTGATLAQPLIVQVKAADGTALSGQVVDFAVQSGVATLAPTSATTDANGKAQTSVTSGSTVGTVVIVATVHSTSLNAIFTATVTLAADPTCAGITPVTMTLGEVRTSVSGNIICLSSTNAAEYMVHAFFASTVASAQTQVGITGSGVVAPTGAASIASASKLGSLRSVSAQSSVLQSRTLSRQLDLRMRQLERNVLAPRMAAARAAMRSRGALRDLVPPTVGSFVNYNVDENCGLTGSPTVRTGRVVAVTASSVVVADTLNPGGGFTDAEYQSFGVTFDTLVDPLDRAAFGAPTDIDANSRIVIFFTSAVNALTPAGSNGIVEGFFNPRDLFPTTASGGLQGCSASNVAEMFYVLVPDPSGTINSNPRPKDEVQVLTIDVLAHEYQHLINAARRLYINNADTFEEVWLNEGLSHIAEELAYYRAAGLTPRQNIDGTSIRLNNKRIAAYNQFGGSNLGRFDTFLDAPTTHSPYADNDSLETRGATWSFLRHAADHQGIDDGTVWSQLDNSKTSGIANLTAVFGSGLMSEFRDWSISVYTDDLVGTTAAFQAPSWNLRSIYQSAFQSVIPFTLVGTPLVNNIQKSFTMVAGGSVYARMVIPAGTTGSASWSVTSPSVQISIVRMK